MKIGDLVLVKLGTGIYEHRKFFDEIGIIVDFVDSITASVYICGETRMFMTDYLELIDENR